MLFIFRTAIYTFLLAILTWRTNNQIYSLYQYDITELCHNGTLILKNKTKSRSVHNVGDI